MSRDPEEEQPARLIIRAAPAELAKRQATIAAMAERRRVQRTSPAPYNEATAREQRQREMYLDRTEAIREAGRKQAVVIMPRNMKEMLIMAVATTLFVTALLGFLNWALQ